MKLDLKLYRGYVNEQELVVFGHLFKSLAPDRYRMDHRGLRHMVSVLRMFYIKPLNNIEIRLKFKNKDIVTKTLDDGYFRFNLPFNEKLDSGWHTYEVTAEFSGYGIIETGEILKPYESKLAIITDIDDTFLISHSNNFLKKLYVLLLRNINKRKIFDDVVEHYQYLSLAGQGEGQASNSFFYVSSSEWNLYGFIHELAVLHEMPKAVIKLKKIKTGISDFFLTGRGSHDHKFEKVKDIISFYPNLKYVLLGDDSQKDPDIYERICKIFPENIKAVYIRQTTPRKKNKVVEILKNMESLHVSTCYFRDSERAISHSKALGIN